MAYDVLIRRALLATSLDLVEADLAVKGGKIVAIGDLSSESGVTEIDASHLTLMPGVIDTQVHFREPGLDHKEDIESGSRAALHGGVTAYLEMPNTNPTTTTREALEDKLRRADGRSWVNYGFFVGASTENIDDLSELELLPGTPGIGEVFMGSSTGPLLVAEDDDLRRVLQNGRKVCAIHAEDEARNVARKALLSEAPHAREHPFLRDEESAILATQRILALSAETGRPVHILHISTAKEPQLIEESRRRGMKTTCEITPQHLWFAAPECYDRLGSLAQMNPPIRSGWHREGLWRAFNEGIFDVFGSDHAPHTLEEKALEYPKSPSGMPGVQTMLPVLLTFVSKGLMTMKDVVRMACERPAELYGVKGKGFLEVGMDADLVLVNRGARYTFERSMVQSKCGWSPFEGEELIGRVETVLLNGQIVLRDGERLGKPSGRQLEFGE